MCANSTIHISWLQISKAEECADIHRNSRQKACKDALAVVKYILYDECEEKLLANQQVIKTPIVRNGKQATVGYEPTVWKSWS